MKTLYIKRAIVKPLGGIGGVNFNDIERNLTGSSFLIEIHYSDGSIKNILVDFGMHQGGYGSEEANRELLFEPKIIDAVLVTHAHSDHVGRVPMLFKNGYKGFVYMSSEETNLISFLQCQDSAKILERNYEKDLAKAKKIYELVRRAKEILNSSKRDKKGNRTAKTISESQRNEAEKVIAKYGENLKMEDLIPKKPIYTQDDVNKMMIHTKSIEKLSELIPCISVKTVNAGHVFGSRSVILTFKKKRGNKRIVFSGDLGSDTRDFAPNGKPEVDTTIRVDAVICESTYGGKKRDLNYYKDGLEDFLESIKKDFQKGKTIFIPAFAFDRAQEVLYHLQFMKNNLFLHSDLASQITEVYKTRNPIYKNLDYTLISQDNQEEVLATPGGKIIVTTSGMMEGGPIVSYIAKYIDNPQVSFYLMGFASPGTLANKLQMGLKQIEVTVFDEKTQKEIKEKRIVKAKIISKSFMSGHGDEATLIRWLNSWKFKKGAPILLNHGDMCGSSVALKNSIERRQTDGRFNPDVYTSVLDYNIEIVIWLKNFNKLKRNLEFIFLTFEQINDKIKILINNLK